MPVIRLLTEQPPPERVVARLGLIADTHLPDRLAFLPPAVFEALAGVDLILHAGDVGELRVLDELSAIAPVVAVHGNDDTAEAQRELPYQQLLSVGGVRLLLSHAHFPDRTQELASRRDDRWAPKLERRAEMGRRAEAQLVVFGHTHVPMTVDWGGLLLVNPGALASGSNFTRQALRSVARLLLTDASEGAVEHFDLDTEGQPFTPVVDLEASFEAALAPLTAPIVDAELQSRLPALRALFAPGGPADDEGGALHRLWRRLAFPRWEGAAPPLTSDELLAALQSELTPPLAARVRSALGR